MTMLFKTLTSIQYRTLKDKISIILAKSLESKWDILNDAEKNPINHLE